MFKTTLADNPISANIVLLDCLTLLATNVLVAINPDFDDLDEAGGETAVSAKISMLITTIQQSSAHWLIVAKGIGRHQTQPQAMSTFWLRACR